MKSLKSNRAPSPSPVEMLRIAETAAPQHPPATVTPAVSETTAMLSVRMMEASLDSLADYAAAKGMTQRRVIAEALSLYGVQISPRDMEDRPLRRRRGTMHG